MDKMLLKRISIQSVALMLAVITMSFARHQNSTIKIRATDLSDVEASETTKQSGMLNPSADPIIIDHDTNSTGNQDSILDTKESRESYDIINGLWSDLSPDIISQMGDKLLIIKKPPGTNLQYSFEDIYISSSVKINIQGSEVPMDNSYIGRINQGISFISDPIYKEIELEEIDIEDGALHTIIKKDYGMDIIRQIAPTHSLNEANGLYENVILIQLDDIYSHSLMEDETYYYIGLKKPNEVHERILVIDAGHGGKDAGALSMDKNTYEKDINLKILHYLKEMLDKEDIQVYYTRLGDETIFLRPRVLLANAVECDFFISIHGNASEATSPNGTEIYYYDTVINNVSNQRLAKILSEELETITSLKNRGIIKKQNDDLFILENALVPAVIVETGFMTNQGDLGYLQRAENQKAIAQGLYNGILRAYDEIQPE